MNDSCTRFFSEIWDGISEKDNPSLRRLVYNVLDTYNKHGEFTINDLYPKFKKEEVPAQDLIKWGFKDKGIKDCRIRQL